MTAEYYSDLFVLRSFGAVNNGLGSDRDSVQNHLGYTSSVCHEVIPPGLVAESHSAGFALPMLSTKGGLLKLRTTLLHR
jgi:hypothetical protein